MRILIRPSDIIKRALWRRYQTYVLDKHNTTDIRKIIEDDEEFEISEDDAYVIKLLACVETDNLVHVFNSYMDKKMENNSFILPDPKTSDKFIYVYRKKLLAEDIRIFLLNFPPSWKPNIVFQKELDELFLYIDNFNKEIEKLDVIKTKIKNKEVELLRTIQAKKRLKFRY